jgi:DNA-directed RNA polymerase specialized sigma24 family protein
MSLPTNQSLSFQTTRWTWVVQLRDGADEAERARILAELCGAYWTPLYVFARRSGKSPHDAEDMTQGFLQHVLKANVFAKAHKARGKLRTFLLTSFRHYLTSQHLRDTAAKRGGHEALLSIDLSQAEARYLNEPQDLATPEELYNRRWARDFFVAVKSRLQEEYAACGKARIFVALEPWLFEEAKAEDFASQAADLKVSAGNFRIMLLRYRKRYRELFREAVADTLDFPTQEEIDQEIRELIRLGIG